MAPMEPRLQLGRYQLYKAGTKKIVEWLIRTASHFADISPLLVAGKSNTSSRINARALVSLAEIIVSAHSVPHCLSAGFEITSTVIELVQKVIDGRQASADWYANQPASDEAETENEAHQFFIETLRKVHCLLTSVQVQKFPGIAKKKSTPRASADMNNLFSKLELEEPSDLPLGSTPVSCGQLPKSHATLPNVTLDKDAGAQAFALYCHLEDLRDVRSYIREVWLDYASGEISLITATMVTETALGMTRIADERFVQSYGAFSDWWYLPQFLSFDAPKEGASSYPLTTTSGAIDTEVSKQDLNDLICPSAAIMLRILSTKVSMAKAKEDSNQPLLIAIDCLGFDFLLSSNVSSLVRMMKLFAERGADRTSRQSHERSEFMFGLINCLLDGDTPLWLVSAYQTYRSMYDIIASDSACASNEYFTKSDRMKDQIRFLRRPGKDSSFGLPLLDNIFADRVVLENAMRTYPIIAGLEAPSDCSSYAPWIGKQLACLQTMPTFMGRALFVTTAKLHQVGIVYANRNPAILAMAHLYTNCRKYGLLKRTWQDMELVLSQQKADHPLVPKCSKSADCFTPLRHYLLCLGTPAITFSSGRIPKLPTAKHVQKHSRKLHVTSEYMNAFTKAYNSKEVLGCWRGDLIETTLKQLADSSNDEKGSKAVEQHTLIELLSVFKKELIRYEPFLNFNYFGFSNDCSTMLNAIAVDVGWTKMARLVTDTSTIMDTEAIVYHLLEDATMASSQSKSVAASKLGTAAAMLDVMIAAQGNEHSRKAFDQSSGRIPKSLRPSFSGQGPIGPERVITM